jgi:hypothetical protein
MQRLVIALAMAAPLVTSFTAGIQKVASKVVVRASDEAPAPAPAAPAPAAASGFGLAELKALAETQNPVVGYYDPLNLSEKEFWDVSTEETIGFLRQAEIKHGRVAMAGFVGFLVHAKGLTWGFPMTLDGQPWPKLSEAGSVPALWDALPEAAKWQIIFAVGCLEWYDEWQYDVPSSDMALSPDKPKHYMKGGMPGKFPGFDGYPFNLYDPFGLFKKASEEKKARGRNIEVNNGRLAMIGLFSLLSESCVPGSVPFLGQVGLPQYTGNVMVPFEGQFTLLG